MEMWQQVDGDGHIAQWSKKPHDYAVTITSGAFKSFNLTVKGYPFSTKYGGLLDISRPRTAFSRTARNDDRWVDDPTIRIISPSGS
jgi:hypothetical protein